MQMIELFRSNDPIELSWAQAVLADEGIDSHIFDYHASIIEGTAPHHDVLDDGRNTPDLHEILRTVEVREGACEILVVQHVVVQRHVRADT